MTCRARIAERLLEVSQNTAMLTTFNEVNMQPIMGLRNQYKELFEKTHNGTPSWVHGLFRQGRVRSIEAFSGCECVDRR